MPSTYNRRPYSVPSPSNSDVKNYYFTHSNWKGLNTDKNFLNVDQETFSDCNNVYLSDDGMLKSRPSLKLKKVMISGTNEITNLINVWCFGDIEIYHSKSTDYYLTFKNNDVYLQVKSEENVKLILVERKIFVFSENNFNYYDIDSNTYNNAEKYIYIPVTKVIDGETVKDNEYENELTDSYITRYLLHSNSKYPKLVGKDVKIVVDGESYYVVFSENTVDVIVGKVCSLYENNFITNDYVTDYPLVQIKNGIILRSIATASTNANEYYYELSYSVDGLIYTELPYLNISIKSIPFLSDNGMYAVLIANLNIYIISLLQEGDGYRFSEWTSLLDRSKFDSKWSSLYFDGTSVLKMITWDMFAITCNTGSDIKSILFCNNGEYSVTNLYTTIGEYHTIGSDMTITLPIQDSDAHYSYDMLSYGQSSSRKYVIKWDIRVSKYTSPLGYVTYTITVVEKGCLDGEEDYIKEEYECDLVQLGPGQSITLPDTKFIQNIHFKVDDEEFADKLRISWGRKNDYYNFDSQWTGPELFNPYTLNKLYNMDLYYSPDEETITALVDAGSLYKAVSTQTCYEQAECIRRPMKNLQDRIPYYGEVHILEDGYGWHLLTTDDKGELCFYYNKYQIKPTWQKTTVGYICPADYNERLITNENLDVITSNGLYTSSYPIKHTPLLFKANPVYYSGDTLYFNTSDALYSNKNINLSYADVENKQDNKYKLFEHSAELDNWYCSIDNTLYISKYMIDEVSGEFRWYFPKINTEELDYDIIDLQPISKSEVAVFTNYAIYYIQRVESAYLYYKSKIQSSCKKGSNSIVSYDGKFTIFPDEKGLAAMSYENFVASTEQTVTYLSDLIYPIYKNFNKNAIKLFEYDYWIFCYKENSNSFLLFDTRNSSWWPITLPNNVNKIINIKNEIFVLSNNSLYYFDKSQNEYYDYDGVTKNQIEWSFTSQKLHLNSTNYYKHISNITLTSVLDKDKEPLDFILDVVNYRKFANICKTENFSFHVDAVRIYVKRLNYAKVNEFQYTLSSQNDNDLKLPLCLSSINVKYKISGQVR